MKQEIYRIIDANLNRAREGLRVCEEVARFVIEDKVLTEEFKKIRHRITSSIKILVSTAKRPFGFAELIVSRDSYKDLGRVSRFDRSKRKKMSSIFMANVQRAEEALRVLEEFCKIVDEKSSRLFKSLRFRVYGLEQKGLAKLKAKGIE